MTAIAISVIWMVLGLAGVVWGADKFTDGSASLAHRMNVPEIVIGLTIVAFGTSTPEFCVSLISALKGSSGMAIGNIVGSNIFNALFIVGCAAAVAPMVISKSTVKKDIPFAVGSSVLLILLSLDGRISRVDGIILLVGFAAFMVYTLRLARKGKTDTVVSKNYGMTKSLLFIVVGLACLVIGSDFFVRGASSVAGMMGVSDAVIGLTIVACGTSLPELATSVISARKGQSALAIGNVIGSNVFNILMILGVTGVVCPMETTGITVMDFGMLLFSMILLWLACFSKYRVSCNEGVLLMIVFMLYISHLVLSA